MCPGYFLGFLVALLSAYVSCLGSYEGNMPTTNVHSVSAHTFPEIGPEVKRVGNWIGSATYSSVLPDQETHRLHASFQKERPFEGSDTKYDSKDCQTRAESDNQDNIMNPLLGFGKPSSQYASRSATDVFKNVQPVSQMAYTSSQGGSTFRGTPQVLGSKSFNPTKVGSGYEMPKFSTVGSSKIFAVQAPKHAYDHMTFKPQDTEDAQSTYVSSQMLHQHGYSQESRSSGNIQTSSSTYGPILMGAPVHSGGPKYTNTKPSIVSSGPIFVYQSGESTQGQGSYSTHQSSVKPSNVDSNQYVTSQSTQTSNAALNVDSQPNKLLNVPVYYSTRGGQSGAGLKPPKQSGNCRDNFGQDSIVSSGEIRLRDPEGAERSNSLPHVQSREDVWQPRKPQTYHIGGPPQTGSPLYSVSGSKPNQIFRQMHPTRSGVQLNVAQSSIASSGEIGMMHANVQSRTQSNNPQIASKPHPIFPERKVTFPPGQSALQHQLYEARQNTRNVQPATGTYASPPQGAYQVLSSLKGTPYKPGTVPSKPWVASRVSAPKPSISDSNEINAVRVRHNKLPISSFGNLQNQWASGEGVGGSSAYSGALQSVSPSSYLGQRRGQNVQAPVLSSVPQYQSSKGVQIQSSAIQNLGSTTHDTTIPNEFGKGVIRRISPTIFSSYKPAPQNQDQRAYTSTSGCEVTQNHPSGLGQQGPVKFQGVKPFSSRSSSQRLQ
nr:uncharacterized protein zgc:175136 [Misgurnus anguillicaudatus]